MYPGAASSPHMHGPASVDSVMLRVVYALLPAIAGYIWLFGWGVLFNIVIAIIAALASEAAVLWLRGRPVRPALADGSALVTALLLGLAVPSLAPWWLTALGAAFGIVMAKQLYGGLGFNPFNPAMVGYVMLLIAFPVEMTLWLPPQGILGEAISFQEAFTYTFTGTLPGLGAIDSVTMATPLDTLKTQLGMQATVGEALQASPVFGHIAGEGWEIVNALILLGGLWLLYKRVITWHVPVAMLSTLFLIALLFFLFDGDRYASPLYHLFSGAAILGAFFIATDPVSGATSTRGRLIFGAGVGLLVYAIRTWGGYPEGVAFAVLLMNMAAPTIDYYTQPRVYGHVGKE